jgi:hypothetical protein
MKESKEELNQEKIEQLKARYGGIYEGEITFNDDGDNFHRVEFIWRRPTTADIESHAKAAQKNPIVANLNLIQSLIVHPEPGPVIAEIREYPAAYGRFCEEAIIPFFGANIAVKTKKL